MTIQPGFAPHVTTLGSGSRRALALHCTMAFGGAWRGFANALPDLTFVAPDMPSHGRSDDWDGTSDFSETVFATTLAAMDDTPMDVIGHSYGGVTALRLAVEVPEKVRSLTVIEPVFFAVARADAPETLALHEEMIEPFQAAMQAGDHEAGARMFNGMWSDDAPDWQSIPERNRAAMVRGVHVVPNTHAYLHDDTAGLLAPGALDACTIPTLILRGGTSHPAIAATNKGLAARIPGSVSLAVEGAGHMAPLSHAAQTAALVQALLDRS